MNEKKQQRAAEALGRIPSGLFILSSRHEDRRMGILTSWVQQVGFKPLTISVAVAKGRPIMPLISESRQFGLAQLRQQDKVILHKFARGIDPNEDPFLGFEMVPNTVTGVPILANVLGYLECELVCHVDVDSDHDLFVAHVCAGDCFEGEPHVHLRENGLRY